MLRLVCARVSCATDDVEDIRTVRLQDEGRKCRDDEIQGSISGNRLKRKPTGDPRKELDSLDILVGHRTKGLQIRR